LLPETFQQPEDYITDAFVAMLSFLFLKPRHDFRRYGRLQPLFSTLRWATHARREYSRRFQLLIYRKLFIQGFLGTL